VPGYDPDALATALKAEALRLGFDGCGIARAARLDDEARRLETWLADGRHASMAWMANHFDKRVDPRELVPGAQSVVSVFVSYWQPERAQPPDAPARVSRYAWGDDYHGVLKEKLAELFHWLDGRTGGAGGRAFTDSAPVMDKVWAQRAGLGWQGKHTNLITRSHGSFVFLGELIVDVPLAPDAPFAADHCGSCTRCLDACPTGALDAPYQIDAERCISYWTIEHRGATFPEEIAAEFGPWIFGCDICQDVCPWTKFSRPTRDARFLPLPGLTEASSRDWAEIDLDAFRDRLRTSPLRRTGHEGIVRNAQQALRNAATPPEGPA
jgi:epoxyqueuosine reductase